LINLQLKKVKSLIILLLTLTTAITTISFLPQVEAEVKIISITPTSGHVGTNTTLMANITTVDGQYTILFDEKELLSGTAVGNIVNVSIAIPPARAGNHTIKVMDEETRENATTTFNVLTAYLLEISPPIEPPQQRQEGDSVAINVTITGGEQDKQFYIANITVQTPNASLVKLLNIPLSEDGSGSETIYYPENFENANTNYVGEYKVLFNETFATASFTIGLTNAREYHRFQVVDIKAAGYKPEENVTLTITGKNVYHSVNLTASSEGVIHYTDWSVPPNASIDTYTVNITSTSPNPTVKSPPDIQDFTVPGFDVNVTARNLAKDPVPEVTFKIFEGGLSAVPDVTSDSDGLASVKLEIGNYIAEAYFKGKKVGEGWINVTEAASFDVSCNLTDLRVLVLAVVDGNEVCVPEVKLNLSPGDLILTPTLTTNVTGIAVFHSLLIDVNYTLNASRYDMQFNTTELQGLLRNGNSVAWFDLNITCPNYTLHVNVTNPNAGAQPISDATVKVHEFLGGLYFERKTSLDGTVGFSCPLGKYRIEVYADEIKLNETTVNLNESLVMPISCNLYGLNVSVLVVDYFGQPIPNANVTLLWHGFQNSAFTKSDGAADFTGIIGGELQAIIYLPGQSQPHLQTTFYVDNSTTFQVKAERYVMFAGFLVETGQLATIIIIVVSVLLIFAFEFQRRRRFKPKAGGSEG
jgi:hypothetical protein